MQTVPAAFRRLCVETALAESPKTDGTQPPSGGCVLKRENMDKYGFGRSQPPSGGCVLKQMFEQSQVTTYSQPPSGGCVLKQKLINLKQQLKDPAAFRRLCVETHDQAMRRLYALPAAFRRLCVETNSSVSEKPQVFQPPSGGCVLKRNSRR